MAVYTSMPNQEGIQITERQSISPFQIVNGRELILSLWNTQIHGMTRLLERLGLVTSLPLPTTRYNGRDGWRSMLRVKLRQKERRGIGSKSIDLSLN